MNMMFLPANMTLPVYVPARNNSLTNCTVRIRATIGYPIVLEQNCVRIKMYKK